MPKLDDQLKAAILRMPVKEKDKLLLRLVTKDAKLIRKLVFELLENGATRDERALALRAEIQEDLNKQSKEYTSPGYLMLYLRHWSGRITEHVLATTDKPGEVILNFFMLAEAFRLNTKMLAKHDYRNEKLAIYVVKKVAALLKKAEKLHEDYFMEFRSDAEEVLDKIWKFHSMADVAEALNLPHRLT